MEPAQALAFERMRDAAVGFRYILALRYSIAGSLSKGSSKFISSESHWKIVGCRDCVGKGRNILQYHRPRFGSYLREEIYVCVLSLTDPSDGSVGATLRRSGEFAADELSC